MGTKSGLGFGLVALLGTIAVLTTAVGRWREERNDGTSARGRREPDYRRDYWDRPEPL
jgi:hypothetical protein